ncbi:glycosyltransferase family 2 protein [Leptolyngbya sp. NK1-12]|uniref:Glycosyltransferase family 2 protein n=1 Tax=Leptolyngbya sp. NK1-12 TaxID=2547451 RepID=A0AA96WEQ2_9CYAN|nr:glycosyltransferase family A protein [Leptolyngbya sp. NK1-12]WNZ23803.1 glycosyltransferase family 2 protein [Leptolyngbya sp. NK1-12]
MPTISVIIPAYNAEKTILSAITSVQKQTFSDWEVIVINDGSTDGTVQKLASISDQRLKVFSYPNAGVSTARNRGLDRASGDYIAFLDADDQWTADKLEAQLAALQHHPDAGVAYSYTHFIFEDKADSFIEDSQAYQGNVYADLLLKNFLHSGSNPLIRKEAILSTGNFNPCLSYGEDWEYWLRLAAKWNFVLVPKPQILYYHSPYSASNQNLAILESSMLQTIDQIFAAAPAYLQPLKRRSLSCTYRYLTQQYLRNCNGNLHNIKCAGKKLWQAVCINPKILLETYTFNLFKWWSKAAISVLAQLAQ